MIALLSSMPFESEYILSCLKNVRSSGIAGKPVFKGKLSGVNTVIMNTGIGKVNAAHSATSVIEKFPVSKILFTGVGGAYPGSGLNNGDIAAASKEILGDEGVLEAKGWGSLKQIGIPLVQNGKKKYFNEYPLTSPSLRIFRSENERDIKIRKGPFVTVSAATGTQKRAKELEKRFSAICENMEGAAAAQVCAIYGIPMIEIRGISNIAGVRDKRKWHLQLASENCQKAALRIITELV
jgi:futalosine hydrolase